MAQKVAVRCEFKAGPLSVNPEVNRYRFRIREG